MSATKYNVLLLLPVSKMDSDSLKQKIKASGLNASYNIGQIPKSLTRTFAPLGGMIFPISMQDAIFDPLDQGDYSEFDISQYWSARDRKDIERNGPSEHLIAACYATTSNLEHLSQEVGSIEGCYVWHWHQWVLISKLNQMNWGY